MKRIFDFLKKISAPQKTAPEPSPLKEEDYYIDPNGLYVFTERYLLKRGFCCGSGCRHCPYGNAPKEPGT